MDALIIKLKNLRHDRKVTGRLYLITLASALLILVLAVKGPEQQGSFLSDDNGNLIGLKRSSLEQSERYDALLTIGSGNDAVEREVVITVRPVNNAAPGAAGPASGSDEENMAAARDAEVDRIITDLELSDEEKIYLPDSLHDGTPLKWKAADTSNHTAIIFIPVMYAALIFLVIYTALSEPRSEEAAVRKEILKGLPRFCNQLFLMMNAGMILSDAFERICECYSEYGEENMTWFERSLTEICLQNADHRTSTASLINEYATRHNVKEMVRIATILTENEKRGSDVIESLSRESRYLWDDRKIIAREAGKMIDTRMSWPLAILLLMLIIITMAPALLNM